MKEKKIMAEKTRARQTAQLVFFYFLYSPARSLMRIPCTSFEFFSVALRFVFLEANKVLLSEFIPPSLSKTRLYSKMLCSFRYFLNLMKGNS